MNELIISRAKMVHQQICASVDGIASAYVTLCMSLKQMRDEKLYEALGCGSFDEYVEQNHPFKARQAYKYIGQYEHFGPKLLTEHADIGVEKLEILRQVFVGDAQEIASDNDLAGMTVAEVRELVERAKGFDEQMSLLTKEKNETSAKLGEAVGKIKELEARPAEVTVEKPSEEDIKKAVREKEKEITKKLEAKFEAKAKAATDEAERKAKQQTSEADMKVVEAEKKRLEAEQALQKVQQELSDAAKNAAEAETLRKKLAAASASGTETFKIYFAEMQGYVLKLMDALKSIEDEDVRAKYSAALKKYIDKIGAEIDG